MRPIFSEAALSALPNRSFRVGHCHAFKNVGSRIGRQATRTAAAMPTRQREATSDLDVVPSRPTFKASSGPPGFRLVLGEAHSPRSRRTTDVVPVSGRRRT
jgi:hypothetical protein